ncbi:MAG: hypothetical protein ABUL58_00160, partial [Steroidobacter sp.]
MKIPGALHKIFIVGCLCTSFTIQGEEIIALAGATDTDDHTHDSYGWQFGFDRSFSRHVGGSLSWTNEGHLLGHHRDGVSVQLWINDFKLHEGITFALGLGPYVYFDTQPSSAQRGYEDIHGVGGILSSDIAFRVAGPWSLHFDVNTIYTPGNTSTYALLLGAGYGFGTRQEEGGRQPTRPVQGHQEVQLFGGKVIFNDLDSRERQAIGVDYRFECTDWVAWSATWWYSPAGQNGRHNRIASEVWLVDHLKHQPVSLSAGIGVYDRLGAAHYDSGNAGSDMNGLFSLRGDWHWTPHTSLV